MHRIGQFVSHVAAHVAPDEAAQARRILNPAAWPLFEGMPEADQRHGLDVVRRLLAQGCDDPDLLNAALLHDAGKGRQLRLWHRVLGVLLETFAAGRLEGLAARSPGPRNPWWIYRHHADLSADLASEAGVSERAISFMRGSASGEDTELSAALHAADQAS